MELTGEQKDIINTNHNLVINAVAGSGKTTTLVAYAKSRPVGSRILYLAFNKTVKTEAIQKFTAEGLKHVKVETAHSLAYDRIMKNSGYQVVQGYNSYDLCEILGIKTGDRQTDYVIGSHVNKFISYFCNNTATRVQEINYADVISDAKAKTFVNNFYTQIEKYTREALAKMDKGEMSVTHDFYLKKFQLSNPVLKYDYILFDEGQDASGAMLDVFLKQAAIKIIVGDTHQQIYGWRYAINSLQQVDFPVFNLSNSFRFNDEVALVANKILSWKKQLKQPAAVKIIGVGTAVDTGFTKATLGRTNLSLLLNAISQWQHGAIKKIFFEGNINSYTFADEGASLYDVLSLYNNKPEKIKDKLIAGLKDLKELEEYIDKTEDNSLKMIVDVVKEFGNKLPSLISELKANHTTTKEEADMIFSTVHRCKGMEYDEVTLLNDFINEEKLKNYISKAGGDKITGQDRNRFAEEINILYVAVTRTKNKLKIPAEINPLISIELASQPTPIISFSKKYQRHSYLDDFDLYEASALKKELNIRSSKPGNYGKKWSAEDVDEAILLFNNGESLKEIAKRLSRGENGVRMKLMDMGLLDREDNF